jgi:hypothetical protein
MWFHFFDMHSGGRQKEDWPHIFIEAVDESQAISVFYSRFGHNPRRITCTCCGEDYAIHSGWTLEEVTEYSRNGMSIEEYRKSDYAFFMPKESISAFEYETIVPAEGWEWR